MEDRQFAIRLNDEQVRERVADSWGEISGWAARLSQPWIPARNSPIVGDDSASTSEFKPTYLTWTSITTATEHLTTAWVHLLNFGPTVFSMRSLFRTAMLGGAHVIWMLAPDDRVTRLERASALSHDARLNQFWWLEGVKDADPAVLGTSKMGEAHRVLTAELGTRMSVEVQPTRIVRAAADVVFRGSPDLLADCLAAWRVLCCAAHALPWDLNMRPETKHYEFGEGYVSDTPATWSDLQAALSIAQLFTRVGWRLIDERGAAAWHAGTPWPHLP